MLSLEWKRVCLASLAICPWEGTEVIEAKLRQQAILHKPDNVSNFIAGVQLCSMVLYKLFQSWLLAMRIFFCQIRTSGARSFSVDCAGWVRPRLWAALGRATALRKSTQQQCQPYAADLR